MTNLENITVAEVDGKNISMEDVFSVLRANRQMHFLQDAVQEIVVANAAAKAGINVSDEELQEVVDSWRQRLGLQSSDATHDWLKQSNMSVDDLENHAHRIVLKTKLKSQVCNGKEAQYHAENKKDFDSATISHIVLDDKNLANELLSQLIDDEADFASLARSHSIDHRSARAGGYVGGVNRKVLSPAVEAVVFNANEGDVVGPVKTDQGFHVIKIEEGVNDELTENRKRRVADRMFADFVAGAERKAKVSWKLFSN